MTNPALSNWAAHHIAHTTINKNGTINIINTEEMEMALAVIHHDHDVAVAATGALNSSLPVPEREIFPRGADQ